jgi:hypothetical protein
MAIVRKYRGRWVADFRDQHGRRRIEAPKAPFETKAVEKRAAQELLNQRLGEVRQNVFAADRQRMQFGRLCKLFLLSKVKIRQTTRDGYQELIDCYLIPCFGAERKVETLTRFEVEQFRNAMAKGAPPAVVKTREELIEQLKTQGVRKRLRPLKPGPRTTNKCLSRGRVRPRSSVCVGATSIGIIGPQRYAGRGDVVPSTSPRLRRRVGRLSCPTSSYWS